MKNQESTLEFDAGSKIHQNGKNHELMDKLSDPDVSKSLGRLLDKVDSIELAVSAMDEMMKKSAALVETMEQNRLANQRMAAGMQLFEKLSQPEVLNNLGRLLDKLDTVDLMLSAADEGIKKSAELFDAVQQQNQIGRRVEGGLQLLDKLTDPDVMRNISRILDKMDTLDNMVSAIAELEKKLPEILACVKNDSEGGSLLDRYYELAGRMAEPKVIANFNNLLDKIENLDAVINILDEIVNRNPDLRRPGSVTVKNINELFQTLMETLQEEKLLLDTVKGGVSVLNEVNQILLSAKMQVVLGGMADAMQKKKEEVKPVGMLGLVKMINDPNVKKSMGLLAVLLQSIGQQLDALDCKQVAELDRLRKISS